MEAGKFLDKIARRHGHRKIVRDLMRLTENKASAQAIKAGIEQYGNSHNVLGIIFEEMTRYDPALPQNGMVPKRLEKFIKDTIENDPKRILNTAPLGYSPDQIWFSVIPGPQPQIRLTGIAEVKLSVAGISNIQLEREEHVILHVMIRVSEMPGRLFPSLLGYSITIEPALSKRVIVPQGSLKGKNIALLPGWKPMESTYSYLDVADMGEFYTGENLADYSQRPGEFQRNFRESLATGAMRIFSGAAQRTFPEATSGLGENIKERVLLNIGASILMGYIDPRPRRYQTSTLAEKLVHAVLTREPKGNTFTEYDRALANILNAALGSPTDENLRLISISRELGLELRSTAESITVEPVHILSVTSFQNEPNK